MNSRVWFVALLGLLAIAALGQSPRSSVGTWSVTTGTMSGPPAVSGVPYSAEEISESVQTLADGTHITHKSTTRMYRDSEGRTRTERSMTMPGPKGADVPVMIEIFDPVAHVHYTLNAREKVAHKRTMASRAARPAPKGGSPGMGVLSVAPFAARGNPHEIPEGELPKNSVEKLGTQTIEGLLVEGTRHTTVWPVGSRDNDQPITAVSETWMSPDLQVVVLAKNNDPAGGDNTRRLTNISRSEPDASLFQPPADYTITEDDPPTLR